MAAACHFLRVSGLPSITTFKDPDTQALDLLQASAAARHSVSWRLKLVGHSAMRRQSGYTGESMIVLPCRGRNVAMADRQLLGRFSYEVYGYDAFLYHFGKSSA